MSDLIKRLSKIRLLPLIVIMMAVFTLLFVILSNPDVEMEPEVKVGFVSTGSKTEKGWNRGNVKGIEEACKNLDVKLIAIPSVSEGSGECSRAVEYLISQGCRIIFLSSYGYAAEIDRLIRDNSDISFYANYTNQNYPNISSYFVRVYQPRYLAGILAGLRTKTNEIGYVAAYKNPEVIQGLNAFAMGVQKVNPDAKVIVNWTNTWEDKEIEVKAFRELAENTNIYLVTYHQNQHYVAIEADALGIYSIGYNGPVEEKLEHMIAYTETDWALTYNSIIKLLFQKNLNEDKRFWLGMQDEVCDLICLPGKNSKEIEKEIDLFRSELKLGLDIFADLIYDNKGNVRCNYGECLSDETLVRGFDWLFKGVEEYEAR